jgi:hypothetical protein
VNEPSQPSTKEPVWANTAPEIRYRMTFNEICRCDFHNRCCSLEGLAGLNRCFSPSGASVWTRDVHARLAATEPLPDTAARFGIQRSNVRMILLASSRLSMRPMALGGTNVALSPSSSCALVDLSFAIQAFNCDTGAGMKQAPGVDDRDAAHAARTIAEGKPKTRPLARDRPERRPECLDPRGEHGRSGSAHRSISNESEKAVAGNWPWVLAPKGKLSTFAP